MINDGRPKSRISTIGVLGERVGSAFNDFTSALFGPGQPISAQPGTQAEGPRRFPFVPYGNISRTPRASEGLTPFEWLISIANLYDTASVCVRYRMQDMMMMDYDVVDRDLDQPASDMEKAECRAFLEKPDGRTPWISWIGEVTEEVLVTDALSIHTPRTRRGTVYEWDLLDGATIKPLVDKWGREPKSPTFAYQQVMYGQIRWEGAVDDLVYLPMHKRTRSMYGRSPTEDLVITINRAIRRQLFDVAFYAEGNVPEAIIPLPDMEPEQIEVFQDYFDNLVSTPQKMRKLHFIPGQSRLTPFQFKQRIEDPAIELFLDKRTMASYGVPPQSLGFTEDTNRSTGGTQENVEQRRRMPFLKFCRSFINSLLVASGFPNCMIQFAGEKPEEDQLREAQVDQILTGAGFIAIDEWRRKKGLKPWGIDKPFIITPTGPVWLLESLEMGNAGLGSMAAEQGEKMADNASRPNRVDSGATKTPGSKTSESKEDTSQSNELSSSDARTERSVDEAMLLELKAWPKWIARRRDKHLPMRDYVFNHVPSGFWDTLDEAGSTGQDEVMWATVTRVIAALESGEDNLD